MKNIPSATFSDPKCKPDDLVLVKLKFANEPPYTEYHLLYRDVEAFIEATYKLHVSPGINPHNGRVTIPVVKILAYTCKPTKYWWTDPSLSHNDDTAPGRVLVSDQLFFTWYDSNDLSNLED